MGGAHLTLGASEVGKLEMRTHAELALGRGDNGRRSYGIGLKESVPICVVWRHDVYSTYIGNWAGSDKVVCASICSSSLVDVT